MPIKNGQKGGKMTLVEVVQHIKKDQELKEIDKNGRERMEEGRKGHNMEWYGRALSNIIE